MPKGWRVGELELEGLGRDGFSLSGFIIKRDRGLGWMNAQVDARRMASWSTTEVTSRKLCTAGGVSWLEGPPAKCQDTPSFLYKERRINPLLIMLNSDRSSVLRYANALHQTMCTVSICLPCLWHSPWLEGNKRRQGRKQGQAHSFIAEWMGKRWNMSGMSVKTWQNVNRCASSEIKWWVGTRILACSGRHS